MKKLKLIALGLASLSILVSCEEEETASENSVNESSLSLELSGLESLGDNYIYENWIIVDGKAVSAGTFSVSSTGDLSQTSFPLDQSQLSSASTYVLTIEPSPDPDPSPSKVHILAGDFAADLASVTIGHPAALADDFNQASGQYILATPTDGGMNSDENSGVWWLDPSGPSATLNLPTLPEGWLYEGWAVVNGIPISTGTFAGVAGSDNSAIYSGSVAGPPFPGEDFLLNAPAGLSFPLDLSGANVVVSVEPNPDNSAAPFTLKPLVAQVPTNAMTHTLLSMDNNSMNSPSGLVRR
jgi:hypothetical protein